MRNYLLVILIFVSFKTQCQLCFIGQNSGQIRSFWTKKVSPKHIVEGKFDSSHLPYFFIQEDTTIGSPVFSAYFDKLGKCIEHNSLFKGEYLEQYVQMLNKNSKLKRKGDRWVNISSNYFYYIKEDNQPDLFHLVCIRK